MENGPEIPRSRMVAIQVGLEAQDVRSHRLYFCSQHQEIYNAKGIFLLICH